MCIIGELIGHWRPLKSTTLDTIHTSTRNQPGTQTTLPDNFRLIPTAHALHTNGVTNHNNPI